MSSRPIILAATKSSFRLLYSEGQPDDIDAGQAGAQSQEANDESFEEGASEDSLFDVLSGKKPLHAKTEQSYTEMVDVEIETEEEDYTTRVDDTFREKRTRRPMTADPFDDSEIF